MLLHILIIAPTAITITAARDMRQLVRIQPTHQSVERQVHVVSMQYLRCVLRPAADTIAAATAASNAANLLQPPNCQILQPATTRGGGELSRGVGGRCVCPMLRWFNRRRHLSRLQHWRFNAACRVASVRVCGQTAVYSCRGDSARELDWIVQYGLQLQQRGGVDE